MPRIAQRRATKGSQKWLQVVVNEAPHLLDRAIAAHIAFSPTDKIAWLSPHAGDSYAEYRDETWLSKLGIRAEHRALRDFWPPRGPQWDGLGRATRGDVFLIEAKAHIGELLSTACAATPPSRKLIERSLSHIKTALGVGAGPDWTATCYQYANRLAHLYFLRVLNKIPAYLVFVYFLNAADVQGPTTAEEWTGAIQLMQAMLGLDDERIERRLGSGVVEVFIDVRDIAAAVS